MVAVPKIYSFATFDLFCKGHIGISIMFNYCMISNLSSDNFIRSDEDPAFAPKPILHVMKRLMCTRKLTEGTVVLDLKYSSQSKHFI